MDTTFETNDIGRLFGATLENIRVSGDDDHYWISADAPTLAAHPCSDCEQTMDRHGKRTVIVTDVPIHERWVKIEIEAPWLRCGSRNVTVGPRPPELDPR